MSFVLVFEVFVFLLLVVVVVGLLFWDYNRPTRATRPTKKKTNKMYKEQLFSRVLGMFGERFARRKAKETNTTKNKPSAEILLSL